MEIKEKKAKDCPFTGEPCREQDCPIFVVLTKQIGIGVTKQSGMCSLPATVMLLSNLIQTQVPQQKIQLPNIKI